MLKNNPMDGEQTELLGLPGLLAILLELINNILDFRGSKPAAWRSMPAISRCSR